MQLVPIHFSSQLYREVDHSFTNVLSASCLGLRQVASTGVSLGTKLHNFLRMNSDTIVIFCRECIPSGVIVDVGSASA